MRKLLAVCILALFIGANGAADELQMISINSHQDAEMLKSLNTDVVLTVNGGYLVLIDETQSHAVLQSGLETKLLATGIRRDQLAVDGRFDRKNADLFEVLYEDGRLRLLLAGSDRLSSVDHPVEVFPLPSRQIQIRYQPPSSLPLPSTTLAAIEDIELLMDRVEQDSLESYVLRLEAFYRRLTGTDSNYAARDWIAGKFAEFGYDSIGIDPFIGSQLWARIPCQSYNVIAYKPGSVFPDQQIIIGGHFDAVPDCPGADDNASGTAAVLECARILKDVDTKMSIVFIAFDSEESWLWGSYHYVDGVIERNDDIVLMINTDMIGHWNNSDRADLYTGPEAAYARLWDQFGNDYLGIDADLWGSIASDHLPFQEAGYDVIFVQEKNFSTEYHQPTDSSVYMNFEYMTRMVKATLATMYAVDQQPPPVRITSILQVGDGQSQLVEWQPIPSSAISFYRLNYCLVSNPANVTSIDVPPTQTSCVAEGLTEGEEYVYYVQAYNAEGQTSFAFDHHYSTPSSVPKAPFAVLAMPLHNAMKVTWRGINTELDFDHYAIIRDGGIVGQTTGEEYVDNDPALGTDLHSYYVTAVDTDEIHSDTVGIEPSWCKAASLEPDRILALNRSSVLAVDFVDEVETGAFMREALTGYDFDYFSDTAASTCGMNCQRVSLFDFVDYGTLVIGAESGRLDDIGSQARYGGILDTLAYYLSIGGKVVIFGRWGDLGERDTIHYEINTAPYDDAYHDYFHIDYRVRTETEFPTFSTFVYGSLLGANSKFREYPNLVWDSLATLAHATAQAAPITDVSAIPCASFVELTSEIPEVLYTYDGRSKIPSRRSQGGPVAWRYLGPDYAYVYFDIPLSFFQREDALITLRQAVDDLMEHGSSTAKLSSADNLADRFELSQNYPNPFNPSTEIRYSLPTRSHVSLSVFNILGQKVITLVDQERPAGVHSVQWNGVDDRGQSVATGIYLYQVKAGDYSESKKMILLK